MRISLGSGAEGNEDTGMAIEFGSTEVVGSGPKDEAFAASEVWAAVKLPLASSSESATILKYRNATFMLAFHSVHNA